MTNHYEIAAVNLLAAKMRRHIVEMIGCEGQTGHLGGACSCADLIASLYCVQMRHDALNPSRKERDKFICSKGHAAIAQYAALAECGYFPVEELKTVKALGSRLQGHPDRIKTPGIEVGTGSLGQGLSISNGLALAARLDGCNNTVYCLMGDGEMAEGQVWEAAMATANYHLDNVVAIVDCNGLQATGVIAERYNMGSIKQKWNAFGWRTMDIDGHNVQAILAAFQSAAVRDGVPTVILASTIKGKGISFAEGIAAFHNSSLTLEQYTQACTALDAIIASNGKEDVIP